MIRRALLLGCLLLATPRLFPQTQPKLIIRGVEVLGNLRIPVATVIHTVSSAPGKVYEEAAIREDLRRLHALGIFRSIAVETQEADAGFVDVIYSVEELPFISEFEIVGLSQGQQDQIDRQLAQEKLRVQPATPFQPGAVNKTAVYIRTWLQMHKYPFAEVRVVTEEERRGTVRVRMQVEKGPHLEVGEVRFSGNSSIKSGDLVKQMKYTRPLPIRFPGMSGGTYMSDSLAADLNSLHRYYQSKGFAAARIGTPEVSVKDFPRRLWNFLPLIGGARQRLAVTVPVAEGQMYRLVSVTSEGNAKAAASQVAEIVASIMTPSTYDYLLLEAKRQKIVDALGHAGYALAYVELEQTLNDDDRTVAARYRIQAGDPVAIGKIHFEGNLRLREKFLRRDVVAREGEVFDSAKLDKSVQRINRSGLIKEMQRADVSLALNDQTQLLDITFKVKEKDRQGIYGTGGTGGVGGGYLGILYTAFDLLGLGESLTFQLDGGASQSNTLLNILGTRFLGLPFNLGLSLFHRVTNFNVASVVPDASDLIHILKHRSTGAGLSGAYPVTSKIQVGLGSQFERLNITEESWEGNTLQSQVQNRTELMPTFSYDATTGTGPVLRGTRFSFIHSWSGPGFLRSIDATTRSFRFSHSLGDPMTKGRNALAFGLEAAAIRPRNGSVLTADRRFYPGDEIVRGFPRGGLSPWAYPTGSQTSPNPLGADTVLGFSMEYRVPIQGPLSATAFVDLGWSRISGKNLNAASSSNLIGATNGLLRGSLGGELRLQLPMIQQPGRLIFGWNFLRLSELIQGKSGVLRLADPRGAIRFALGDRF